ncbi:MAG: hypothetical protein V1776_04290 [Candidatus Diapherotrites archaeon]
MDGIVLNVLVFLGASLILVKASSFAVKYVVGLAKAFHLTEFMAAFVLAGFVSILPEFFIGVNAALDGFTDAGIGTLIGNNLVDLTLVIGIVAILGRELSTSRYDRMSTIPFIVMMALPFGLMLDGLLSFIDGLLLITAAILYFAWLISREEVQSAKKPIVWKQLLVPLSGFGLMMLIIFLSSKYVVESAVSLSTIFGIPEVFAGLFIISVGASLPELTFSVQAVLSRHKSIALGDILGNVALDATFSIGVMAIIRPIPIQFPTIGVSALIMVFAALMLTTYLDNDHKLNTRDGIALIGLFIVFVVVQLALNVPVAPAGVVHP